MPGKRLLATLAFILGLVVTLPHPAAGQDDPVAAAAGGITRQIDDGRILDALAALRSTFEMLPPPHREAWFNFAARTCVSLGSASCAADVLNQPAVLAFEATRIDPQTAASMILLHAWATAMNGDESGAQKIVDKGIPPALATPLSSPVLFAELALLAAQRARRVSNFALSRSYLDTALATTLSFQSERHDARGLVLRIIRQHVANYDAERALRLFAAAGPLFDSLPSGSVQYLDFLDLRAELHGYRGDLVAASLDLTAMLHLLDQLQIDGGARQSLRASTSTQLIALEALGGHDDLAAMLLRLHPLAGRRDEIRARGRFANATEFWFAIMEEFIAGDGARMGIPDWRPLLERPVDWTRSVDELEHAEAYARAAVSLNRLRRGDGAAKLDLVNAAYLRLATLHRLHRLSVFASPLPSWLDRLLFESAVAATLSTATPDLSLVVGAHLVLSRSLQSRADDTLAALARQRTEPGRRAVQGLYTTDLQRIDWETGQLRALGQRLAGPGDRPQGPPEVATGRAAIVNAANDFTRRQRSLRAALVTPPGGHPDGYIVGVKALQHLLQSDEALLFYVNLVDGRLGKVCLRRDRATARYDTMLQTDGGDAERLMQALLADHPPSPDIDLRFPVTAAVRLNHLLLGGLGSCLDGARRVHYVPPPGLPRLPPGALLSQEPPALGNGYDLRAARWRVRDHAFVHTTSVSAFMAARRLAGTRTASLDYLGIGDPELAASTASLPELPEASQELQAVAGLFAPDRARVLRRADATEQRLREAPVGAFDIVHFATHGLTRQDVPDLEEPGLVLAAGAAGDGLLTASRIATLPLRARLVVLSACNSARYEALLTDRGIQGLATSFTIAGVPSIVAALWPIESALARDTMVATFRFARAAEDAGIAESLAAAQRQHLDGPTPRPLLHPRFWASLVVLGDGAVTLGGARP